MVIAFPCVVIAHTTPDLFLAVVTASLDVGNVLPSSTTTYNVSRILDVGFYSLNNGAYDDIPLPTSDALPSPVGYEQADRVMRDASYNGTAPPPPPVYEHPCAALTKILTTGTFYYASDMHWDISSRLSERIQRDHSMAYDIGVFDSRFIWNEYIARSLLDFRERMEPQERHDLDKCKFVVCRSIHELPLPHVDRFWPYKDTLAYSRCQYRL